MASTPNLTDRTAMTLWATGVMLDDALTRAPDWDTRPEAEQLDVFLEWEELMDRLIGVAAEADAGRLPAEQRGQLATLATRLIAARSTVERLGLDYPDLERLSRAS
jgi:hypothetical protein